MRHFCGDITISDYYFFGDITFGPKSDFADKVIFRISKAEAALRLALSGALPANERAVRILEIWIFSVSFLERSMPSTTVDGIQILCLAQQNND